MRTYGRTTNPDGTKTWQVVQTDASGYNDFVYITTLAQCCLLNLGEDPFWSQLGVPAYPSIVQQVFPDFYIAYMQQFFAPFFASLQLSSDDSTTPTYNFVVVTNQGVTVNASVPIPY